MFYSVRDRWINESMKHCWNGVDRGITEVLKEKNLSHCQSAHRKSYMDWTDPEFTILGIYGMPWSLTIISMYIVYAA